jgi:hypothetical protein
MHMPYQVTWDDEEQTIAVQTYSGTATMKDYYQAIDESAQLLSSVDHTVDLIMDLTAMKSDLKGFLTAVSYANKQVPANQRLVVVVGANRFVQTMGRIAGTIAPKATENVYFVDTLEDAHRVITEYRRSQDQSE